jgi:metal-sulfur cluster biosynthetic enzyme
MNEPAAFTPPSVAAVRESLRDVLDPEVGLSVVQLGMIGEVTVFCDGDVAVEVMPTTPGCPMHDAIAHAISCVVGSMPGVASVEVLFVYDPPWTPDRITPEARTLLGIKEA